MLWIADEALSKRIDNEVEYFQRDLTNECRTIVWNLGNFDVAFTTLNYDPSARVYARLANAGRSSQSSCSYRQQAELFDISFR